MSNDESRYLWIATHAGDRGALIEMKLETMAWLGSIEIANTEDARKIAAEPFITSCSLFQFRICA